MCISYPFCQYSLPAKVLFSEALSFRKTSQRKKKLTIILSIVSSYDRFYRLGDFQATLRFQSGFKYLQNISLHVAYLTRAPLFSTLKSLSRACSTWLHRLTEHTFPFTFKSHASHFRRILSSAKVQISRSLSQIQSYRIHISSKITAGLSHHLH